MSKKIELQQAQKQDIFTIDEYDFKYLNDLDVVQNSFNFYYNQLKTNFLQGVALRLGYDIKDKLEFEIDLKDQSRKLTIKRITEEDQK